MNEVKHNITTQVPRRCRYY